jgi:UDP-2,3-diacylglucosamine pyrophosphatase LpxH
MCPPESRARLAQFVHHLVDTSATRPGSTELVINGDFVDFLAEEKVLETFERVSGFDAFTYSPPQATAKLRSVLWRTDVGAQPDSQVFPALQRFVREHHKLTILLGNHDVELSIPQVRTEFVDFLSSGGPGRIEFLYDNEAYAVGDLLIEHGNRYDEWNLVLHDNLRRYRSAISREEPNASDYFEPPPGSKLVTNVMNDLKQEFPFVDLLKPETEAMLPILVALKHGVLRKLGSFAPLQAEAYLLSGETGAPPPFLEAIAAQPEVLDKPQNWLTEYLPKTLPSYLSEIASPGDSTLPTTTLPQPEVLLAEIAANPTSKAALVVRLLAISLMAPKNQTAALRRAFLKYREVQKDSFNLTQESPSYLEQARRLARDRPKVVVFGHTHLAKHIEGLNSFGAAYVNTGTWCPILRLPDEFYEISQNENDEGEVSLQIQSFVADMRTNRLALHYRLRPTFARVVLSADGRVQSRELCEFTFDGKEVPLSSEARL